MKNLKILILLCGAASLVLMISSGLNFSEVLLDTIIMLAAFGLPTVVALLAISKPPAQAWHGALALAGFGVAAVRTKIWESLPSIGDLSGKGKAGVILIVLGVVVSLLAMVKPEASA